MNFNLERFLNAQQKDYQIALSEIRSGRKRSHWMWYIFPQIDGLGQSETSIFYAIKNMEEAKKYLNHSVLGHRLREISAALLNLGENNARLIFGSPDDLKLKSCMTLFAQVDENKDRIFRKVLDKFFGGHFDRRTLELIGVNAN